MGREGSPSQGFVVVNRETLARCRPGEAEELGLVRVQRWMMEQLTPDQLKEVLERNLIDRRFLLPQGMDDSPIFTSGVTKLIDRPKFAVVGISLERLSEHQESFQWGGLNFRPSYSFTDETNSPPDNYDSEILAIEWERDPTNIQNALHMKFQVSNLYRDLRLSSQFFLHSVASRGTVVTTVLAMQEGVEALILTIHRIEWPPK